MEHIHNFLTIPFDSTSVVEVSNWLTHAHYIHAIDYERHCVLVFNIQHKAIAQLIRLGLCDYDDFSFKNSPNPPRYYVKLFRFIDWHLFENISAYRWFAQRQDYRAFSTIAERYKILDAAFYHDGYSAWRVRYYLSRRLMGMDANRPDIICINLGTNDTSLGNYDIDAFELAYKKFLVHLRTLQPQAKIVMLTGPMLHGEALKDVTEVLDRLAETDDHYYRFDLSEQTGELGYGADHHPSAAQAARNGEELTAYLRTIID